jgi:hypothetical protein
MPGRASRSPRSPQALELDPFETDPHFLLGAVAAANTSWLEAARNSS